MAWLSEPEDIMLLSAPNKYQDVEGAWHEGERVSRTVQCQYVIYSALSHRNQIRDSNVRLQNIEDTPETGYVTMATVELWTIDYEGEDEAIYRGEEVHVEVGTTFGARTQLILRRRIGNG